MTVPVPITMELLILNVSLIVLHCYNDNKIIQFKNT